MKFLQFYKILQKQIFNPKKNPQTLKAKLTLSRSLAVRLSMVVPNPVLSLMVTVLVPENTGAFGLRFTRIVRTPVTLLFGHAVSYTWIGTC